MTCCSSGQQSRLADPLSPSRLAAAIFLAANSMVLSLAVNTSPLSRSEARWLHAALILLTALVVALTRRVWPWQPEWKLQAPGGMDTAFLIGMAAATCYSFCSVWTGDGNVYFEVVCILVVIHTVGSAMKHASQARVITTLQTIKHVKPQYVWRSTGAGRAELVLGSDLTEGDEFWVAAGETIAVDATVLDGESFIDSATTTGESFWASCRAGDQVSAGARSIDGLLRLRVDATSSAISAEALATHVLRGIGRKARIEGMAEHFAKRFVFIVIVLASLVCVYWWRRGGLEAAVLNAMAALLVACPCALGFATPIALWSALMRLGRLGIVTRDTAAIERLAGTDTVIFDKTGTLTSLNVTCSHLRILTQGKVNREDLLSMLATAQAASRHPIAKAFVTAAAMHVGRRYRISSLRQLNGRGIEAEMMGREAAHKLTILDWSGISAPPDAAIAAAATLPTGSRALAILVDDAWVAVAGVEERGVTDLRALNEQLRELGVGSAVVSGDSAERLHKLGEADVSGGHSPAAKARRVVAEQASGRHVCFVGDGVNDAMAMARSHVSIAVADGSVWALAAADFLLQQKDLRQIPDMLRIARETMHSLRWSLLFAASYNAVGIAAAAAGLLHPVSAACLMLTASLTVTYRSLRLIEH